MATLAQNRPLRTRFLVAGLSLSVWLSVPLPTAGAASPSELSPSRPAVVGESRWQPSDPIRVGRSNAYLDLGLVGTVAAGGSTASDIEGGTQLGGHDPNQRGFTLQGVELNLSGAVDPYFRGNLNLSYALDAENESAFELEEAWMETVSLPANLQLRAGQIYTDFGRQNSMHLHSWAFVDSPLANGRFLGPDGLRNPGARVSWLAPTPFFSELSLALQNSHGETATSFRGEPGHGHEDDEGLPFAYRESENDRGVHQIDDLLISGRYSLSFGLTEAQTLLLGVSAAMGPNNSGDLGSDTQTEIYGLDLLWKWQASRQQGGFPFLAWQTEAMYRRYDAGTFNWDQEGNLADNDGNGFPDEGILIDPQTLLPAVMASEELTDYGLYTQLLYGFRKGWVIGLRYDYLDSDRGDYEERGLLLADNAGAGSPMGRDPARDRRWRLSPNLTWFPSEYSKLRLQYNYDDRRAVGEDHSVWLQFEFSLGAHPAHRF
jgi:hypothetical protein